MVQQDNITIDGGRDDQKAKRPLPQLNTATAAARKPTANSYQQRLDRLLARAPSHAPTQAAIK